MCACAAPSDSIDSQPASALLTEGAPGYVHDAQRAHLDLTGGRTEAAGLLLVTQGKRGVHSLDPVRGFSVAHTVDPEIRHAHPFRGTAADHNQLTQQAFVESGLPEDQVSRVLALGIENEWGTLEGNAAGEEPERLFEGYLSRVERQVGGVPVIDSFALARFNGRRQSFLEISFWPAIPPEVIQEAMEFRAALERSKDRAVYLAKLPPEAGARGEVVIRHTRAGDRTSPLRFFVVFDVLGTGAAGRAHYDRSGAQIRLPFEQLEPAEPTPGDVETLDEGTAGPLEH
jgi:hypothetical protein